MKLPISPEVWLLTNTSLYVIIGLLNVFVIRFTTTEYIQTVWLVLLSLPVIIPMSKIVDIDPFWRNK